MTADTPTTIFLGQGAPPAPPVNVLLKYGNRHGLVTGATGTGKTVTLQVLAEAFSRAGVPVFCADVKGDLAGIAAPGGGNARVEARAAEMGLAPLPYAAAPTVFWDLYGEKGHPVRTTVSEMGPLLLSRLLGLNDTQEGVLAIALRVADEQGLALLDLKDLRQLLVHVGQHAAELTLEYGNVAEASVGAVQRALLQLESEGAKPFFGEPALALSDLIRTAPDGRGIVNVLAADRLMQNPKAYATFLLWLLAELFEELPEVGDPDKPTLVFFFDEAHLLFADAPKALLEKIEQVVRLIRSKGVGIWFVTQNPLDVPESVLAQLGNRVQHALRAFTPRDQKAVRTAAETFRPNPAFSTEEVITQLAVGEALLSPLLDKGIPAIVERANVRPPASRIGVLTPDERTAVINGSALKGKYEAAIDRESAYEVLKRRAGQVVETAAPAPAPQGSGPPPAQGGIIGVTRTDERPRAGAQGTAPKPAPKAEPKPRTSTRQSTTEAFTKSTMRSVGTTLGRELTRGILGSLFKRRR